MRPPRVLMVSQRAYPHIAGAEMQALSLARALRAQGAYVRLLTTRHAAGLPSRDVVAGVPLHRMPTLRQGTAPAPLVDATRFVEAAVAVAARARGFDIVHAHCISATSLGAVAGARIACRPVLLKPSLGGPGGEMEHLSGGAGARLARHVLRHAGRFAVLDRAIEGDLLRAGVPHTRLSPVDNGVDVARFHPAHDGERAATRRRLGLPEGPVVLFAGQLVERKGIAPLLAAWERALPIARDATLVFAGAGAEEPRIRAAALPRTRLVGVRRDVEDLMRASDVFVLPSVNESFGNVVLEAMASSLPVVSGPTGVAMRASLDGRAGFVVDPRDPDAIARALLTLLTNTGAARRLGRTGRQIAEDYDFARVAGRYLDLYAELIEETRHGSAA